jgi:hypothetical protein
MGINPQSGESVLKAQSKSFTEDWFGFLPYEHWQQLHSPHSSAEPSYGLCAPPPRFGTTLSVAGTLWRGLGSADGILFGVSMGFDAPLNWNFPLLGTRRLVVCQQF